MKTSVLCIFVLTIVSSLTFADEPKGQTDIPQRDIAMSMIEHVTLSFEKAGVLQEGLSSVKIIMDGKTMAALKPNGEAVEDFKLVAGKKPTDGPAKLELIFQPTKARSNTFELIPVYEKGREGKGICKLHILVKN